MKNTFVEPVGNSRIGCHVIFECLAGNLSGSVTVDDSFFRHSPQLFRTHSDKFFAEIRTGVGKNSVVASVERAVVFAGIVIVVVSVVALFIRADIKNTVAAS